MLRFCLCLAAVLLAAISSAAVAQDEAVAEFDARMDRGRQLLEEGRCDEAMLVYNRWSNVLQDDLLELIAAAEKASDDMRAQRLRGTYLKGYPFGFFWWRSDRENWEQVAMAYADASIKERAALADYRILRNACKGDDRAHCIELTDRFFKRHPESILRVGAVLSVAHAAPPKEAKVRREGAAEIYKRYLDCVPPRDNRTRAVLLFALANVKSDGLDEASKREARASYLQLAKVSQLQYEKQFALHEAGTTSILNESPESVQERRGLLRRYLREYPEGVHADDVRQQIVATWLAVAKPDTAMAEIRRQQQEGLADDSCLASSLFTVAVWYRGNTHGWFEENADPAEPQKALEVARLVVREYPESYLASYAWCLMGEIHHSSGDHPQMVEAYMQAARYQPKQGKRNPKDVLNPSSEACQALGTYYTKQQEWSEALFWWNVWEPRASCGFHYNSMQETKQTNTLDCLVGLGRLDEAGTYYLEHSEIHVCSIRPLVRAFHQQGRLADLEEKIADDSASSLHHFTRLYRAAQQEDVAAVWKRVDVLPLGGLGSGLPSLRSELSNLAKELLLARPEISRQFLLNKLDDAESYEELSAARLLGRMQAEEMLPFAKRRLNRNSSSYTVSQYLIALRDLGSKKAKQLVADYASRSEDEDLRAQADELLEGWEDRP